MRRLFFLALAFCQASGTIWSAPTSSPSLIRSKPTDKSSNKQILASYRLKNRIADRRERRPGWVRYGINRSNSNAVRAALVLRGGEDVFDGAEDGFAEEEFAEAKIQDRIWAAWKKTPFITKYFFQCSIVAALVAFIFNGNTWPKILDLDWRATLKGQIWRPITAFLYFGPLGLNYFITMHFVWTYMCDLERMKFGAPHDFVVMIVFGALSLLASTTALGMSGQYLGHSLSCFLVYVWSREYEGNDVNVLDMFTMRAELLPWFFVLQTLILEGEAPTLDIMGIFSGYLYKHLTRKNWLSAPTFLVKAMQADFIRRDYKRFEKEFGVEVADPVVPDTELQVEEQENTPKGDKEDSEDSED